MAKKPTIKELNDRLILVTNQLNFCTRMLESIGISFSEYVKFSGHEEDFKKHLEKSKNLTKLTKEERDAREKGHLGKNDDVSTEKIRDKENAAT
tara:strand:+ start:558 stop:839 length:282 start_codon:yes stop_codon:yes gene_type:complete